MTGNDITTLLDTAAEPSTIDSAAVQSDLARGRRALARTRARRRVVGTLGVFAIAAVGVSVSQLPDAGTPDRVPSSQAPAAAGIRLVAKAFPAGPYTFDKTPEGWVVQGESPQAVTIAPADGSAGDDPSYFLGKLVIMFDQNPPSGTPADVDGRRFWVIGDSGHTRITTATLPGEPDGMVSIQFPDDAGWDRDTMFAFLGSVHVGEGAQPGVG